MATVYFANEKAEERFKRCKSLTKKKGDYSLDKRIEELRRWTNPIVIGYDHDEMSFTFREDLPEDLRYKGVRPVNGGIIYHGARDGFGSGNGPTFSVTIDKAEGYLIHT